MNNLKEQLIKLGSDNKSLRPHIRPILADLAKAAAPVDFFDEARSIEQSHLEDMRKDLVRLVKKAAHQLDKYGFEVSNKSVWVNAYERPQMEITFRSEPLEKRKVESILRDVLGYGGYVKSVTGGVEWSFFVDLSE
jgi:hypothetical protein